MTNSRSRVGVVLPTFRSTAQCLELAEAYAAVGVDGLFAYDHLWPISGPGRPALHGPSVIAAAAARLARVYGHLRVGTLVARIGLLSGAELIAYFEHLMAIVGPSRVVAGLGLGDAAAATEAATYGITFAPVAERAQTLAAVAGAANERGAEVWVGGNGSRARELAASNRGAWNAWELEPEQLLRARAESPNLDVTWAGAVRLRREPTSDAGAEAPASSPRWTGTPAVVAGQLLALEAAGASWLVVGPVPDRHSDEAQPELVRQLIEHFLGQRGAPVA